GILVDPRYEHQGLQRTGTLLASDGRLDEAERTLVRSLELSPNCAHCWAALIKAAVARNPSVPPDLPSYGLDDRLTVDGLFWRSARLGEAGFVTEAVRDFDRVFAED